jgi:hypothetical protein
MVAQSNAYKEWAKEKTVMITMRLQRSTDADILAYLDGKQKQTEIKKALRYYISAQAEKTEYKYGMRLRGFSPGAQPKEVLRREDDPTGKYHDIIVYGRQLSADEIADYELDDMN